MATHFFIQHEGNGSWAALVPEHDNLATIVREWALQEEWKEDALVDNQVVENSYEDRLKKFVRFAESQNVDINAPNWILKTDNGDKLKKQTRPCLRSQIGS